MCRQQFENLWFLRLPHTECACYFTAIQKNHGVQGIVPDERNKFGPLAQC